MRIYSGKKSNAGRQIGEPQIAGRKPCTEGGKQFE
jgi:hypothetical protein